MVQRIPHVSHILFKNCEVRQNSAMQLIWRVGIILFQSIQATIKQTQFKTLRTSRLRHAKVETGSNNWKLKVKKNPKGRLAPRLECKTLVKLTGWKCIHADV